MKRAVDMRLSVKFTFLFLIFAMLSPCLAFAFDLDETVDDEIRKNYNDSKLVNDTGIKTKQITNKPNSNDDEDLPDLPKILNSPNSQKSPDIKTSGANIKPPVKAMPYTGGNVKVRKGTVFGVHNSSAISDWQKRGTSVKFTLKKQQNGKGYTIPAWTTFNGEIVESHQPQITCNGGLVAIHVYSMTYKGQTIPINAYVTRANDKKIFFNTIKGDRTYLKTMWKKGNWGRSLFNRMLNLTINLGSGSSTLILSPFPLAYGTICLGANALLSPITAFFSKGGHVSIPADSKFNLKLNDDIFID